MPKINFDMQGDRLNIEAGGSLNIKAGGQVTLDAALSAALTTQLTTITPADAAGTPDYSIAAVTNSSPFGFSNAAEAITLLYVVKNLQVRVAELESRLRALGFLS
jgi:hypothetical protein